MALVVSRLSGCHVNVEEHGVAKTDLGPQVTYVRHTGLLDQIEHALSTDRDEDEAANGARFCCTSVSRGPKLNSSRGCQNLKLLRTTFDSWVSSFQGGLGCRTLARARTVNLRRSSLNGDSSSRFEAGWRA